MAATYDETLASDTDRARAMLGDTDVTDALFSDEHIAAVISAEGSLKAGVAFLADELVARFAQDPIKTTIGEAGGTISVDFSARIDAWRALASRSRADAAAGGLSFVTAAYGADSSDEYARPPSYWP